MTRTTPLRHLAIVALAALSVLLASAGTATAAQWQRFNTDADGLYDVSAIDRDLNGSFEDVYFDLDNDGQWDSNMYNTRFSDSFLEVLDFDMDENGEVEARVRDADQRVGFDYVLMDLDQNGRWDSFGGYTQRILPGSNLDIVTKSNRRNASSAMIYNFRRQTGMSLLYPNIPAGY